MNDAPARLAALEPRCSAEDALALYDSLPALTPGELRGRWRGRELATGHPWEGVLTASGWFGKQFDDDERVHPLLFTTPGGALFPLDPRWVPLALVGRVPLAVVRVLRRALGVVAPLVRARRPGARLRPVSSRGVVTAAMVYDDLPIIDSFRRVDAHTVLGLMDVRGSSAPYFFLLTRP